MSAIVHHSSAVFRKKGLDWRQSVFPLVTEVAMGKKELDGEDAWARQGRERVCLGLVFNDLEINGQLHHLGQEAKSACTKN